MHASTASEEDGTSPPLTSQRDGVTGRSKRKEEEEEEEEELARRYRDPPIGQ